MGHFRLNLGQFLRTWLYQKFWNHCIFSNFCQNKFLSKVWRLGWDEWISNEVGQSFLSTYTGTVWLSPLALFLKIRSCEFQEKNNEFWQQSRTHRWVVIFWLFEPFLKTQKFLEKKQTPKHFLTDLNKTSNGKVARNRN